MTPEDIEALRHLTHLANGEEWAFSHEVQGEAPAVVLHADELRELLAVLDETREALQVKSEAYHSEFITDSGEHFAMAWSNCTASTCTYDRSLLGHTR